MGMGMGMGMDFSDLDALFPAPHVWNELSLFRNKILYGKTSLFLSKIKLLIINESV